MLNSLFLVVIDLLELAGVGVTVAGLAWASAGYVRELRGTAGDKDRKAAFRAYRANIGRAILLGLEFLVAADIIKTVAMEPTLESVGILAAVVVVRTFLSFALQVEIDGRWPWQQGRESREGSL
ncbi:DUF1622 domain-containing protein [Aureimonas populi]|uniref:DUF1622 domain-containing protein n=1 Tax=Aureimonas populi TaxID=1701758 RepID=A0ABW5CL51_9HYPH|nr:DUF1622 domain-containing protein [Aureimonas populi]